MWALINSSDGKKENKAKNISKRLKEMAPEFILMVYEKHLKTQTRDTLKLSLLRYGRTSTST